MSDVTKYKSGSLQWPHQQIAKYYEAKVSVQSCKEQKIMKTLESDRGDQRGHESVVTVHGVRASTIWRNQNKHCSIFGRGRLASIALPGQDEMQQMGRS